MINANIEAERHTIPRWNSIYVSEKLGEMSALKESKSNPDTSILKKQLSELLEDWKHEKNITLASEIISTAHAFNSDENIEDVIQYARKKIEQSSNAPKLLIDSITDDAKDLRSQQRLVDSHRVRISKIKKSLIQYPYNSYQWIELAREYVILGQVEKAKKAIHVAYNLLPENRLILRAISRFYTHLGDTEQALAILRKSTLLKSDPWVLAAEISTSNIMGNTSRNIRSARQMIEDHNNNPLSLSELASELGTMEFFSANQKNGKRYIRTAVKAPFENSVAQMVWINRNLYNIAGILEESIPDNLDCNYEALMRVFIQKHNWKEAERSAGLWQEYQPFSHVPAIISSFISSEYTLDFDKAIKSLKIGLKSNPDNVELLNNYVYSLVQSDRLAEAEDNYKRAVLLDSSKKSIALIATGGLLEYRKGNPKEGRLKYKEAICLFEDSREDALKFLALLCFAREEKRIGNAIDDLLKEIDSPKNVSYKENYREIIDNYGLYN